MTLTFNLMSWLRTPKVDRFMSCPGTTCDNLHWNQFTRFHNIVFTSLAESSIVRTVMDRKVWSHLRKAATALNNSGVSASEITNLWRSDRTMTWRDPLKWLVSWLCFPTLPHVLRTTHRATEYVVQGWEEQEWKMREQTARVENVSPMDSQPQNKLRWW